MRISTKGRYALRLMLDIAMNLSLIHIYLMSIASGKTLDIAGICDILSQVGLCARDYINRELNGSLSGGELKRIEIAMIKARATKLSVFDEPEAGIDLWSFNSLIHVFEDLHEKTDGTILIISHQERILEIADRIIVINDGLVEKSGKGEEVIPELLYKSSMCQKLNSCLLYTSHHILIILIHVQRMMWIS